eukprot:1201503-Amphidinium_carterae.1
MSGFIVHVFKEIACLFHPRTATSELIAVQACAIADRIRNPRFANTSVCASDGKRRGSGGPSQPSGSAETAPARLSGSADASVSHSTAHRCRRQSESTEPPLEDEEAQMAAAASDCSHVSRL